MIRTFLALTLCAAFARADENTMLIYLGTSPGSKNDARGIYLTRLDLASGKLTAPTLAAEAARPSFLALHPKLPVLYACSEVSDFEGKKGGGVEAYSYDTTSGALKPLNRQPSGGMGPCFVEVDPDGKALAVANYSSGSVALLPIDETGKLAPPSSTVQHKGSSANPKRQEGPHAHSIRFHRGFAFAADLGTDQLLVYGTSDNKLTPAASPFATLAPGAGPRHIAFNGDCVYVGNELGNTITVFHFAPPTLRETQTISTLPRDFAQTSYVAEVAVHPNGKFLYTSNRGHDSIAAFAIDPSTGHLTATGHTPTQGSFPRHFAIDPTGQYLLAANQNSNTLALFRVEGSTGALTPAGDPVQVAAPTCVRFVPPIRH